MSCLMLCPFAFGQKKRPRPLQHGARPAGKEAGFFESADYSGSQMTVRSKQSNAVRAKVCGQPSISSFRVSDD